MTGRIRPIQRTALAGAAVLIAGAFFMSLPASGRAEDTCVPTAPLQPQDVIGLTWSGSVVQIRNVGVDEFGVEHWTIAMAVDSVYAHLEDHDIPRGKVLAPGLVFDLPSDNCGRKGDMGMRVGARYLVSTSFIDPNGTSIQGLIVWQMNGGELQMPRGLYQTSFVSAELISVETVAEAFEVLGIHSQPSPTPLVTAAATKSDGPTQGLPQVGTDDGATAAGPLAIGIAVGVLLGAVCLALISRKRGKQK